jgi:acetyl-CoA acetyltransferase family protein
MVSWYSKHFTNPKLEPVLIDYVRTPLGSKKGTLRRLRGDDMLVHCLKSIMERNQGVNPVDIGDVIAGCNSQIGACALDVAKTAALSAGLPMSVPGVSLNRQCASGMQALYFGWMELACGDKEAVLVGGVESQNVYPIMADMDVGGKVVSPNSLMAKNPEIIASAAKYGGNIGGQILSAEYMAQWWHKKSGLSREEFRRQLDETAYLSHMKAVKGAELRHQEIVPIPVPKLDENGNPLVTGDGAIIEGQTELSYVDESVRPNTTMEKLATLKPIVMRRSGFLTAGNSCPTTDGACAMLWTTRGYAEEHSLKVRATLEACYNTGSDTVLMLTGPIESMPPALKRAELTFDDMSVIEINEAFSSVVWASCHELGLDYHDPRFNPLGSAMAIGHPTGMTGCRLLGTILHQLEASQKTYGIASLCVGLGMGIGGIIKREGA